MRSLQRVVHRLGGYVRGLERCVRLQAIAKTAVCVLAKNPNQTNRPNRCTKATREVYSASPDRFGRVYGQKLSEAAASQLEYVGRRARWHL